MEVAAFYQRHALAVAPYRNVLSQPFERLCAGGGHQTFASIILGLTTGQTQQSAHCRSNAEPG